MSRFLFIFYFLFSFCLLHFYFLLLFFYIFTSLSYSIVRVRLIEFALVLRSCCFALLCSFMCVCWCLVVAFFARKERARNTNGPRTETARVSERVRATNAKRQNEHMLPLLPSLPLLTDDATASLLLLNLLSKICTKFTNFMLISAKIGSKATTTKQRQKSSSKQRTRFCFCSLNLSDVLEWKLSCSLCFVFASWAHVGVTRAELNEKCLLRTCSAAVPQFVWVTCWVPGVRRGAFYVHRILNWTTNKINL